MLDHNLAQMALRAKASTLSVATTGSTTLAATKTGYTRLTGSFIDDGFIVGMEVLPSGFSTNPPSPITSVSDLALTVLDARSAESSAALRTLSVGLPSVSAWENIDFNPPQGAPYLEEQYVPGAASLDSFGNQGDMTTDLLYVLNVYVPEKVGISSDGAYANAILELFSPSTAIVAGTDTLFVMANPAPYRGQRQQSGGFSVIPVKIPLRCYTNNA